MNVPQSISATVSIRQTEIRATTEGREEGYADGGLKEITGIGGSQQLERGPGLFTSNG